MANKNTLRTNAWDAIYTYLKTTDPISVPTKIYGSFNSKLVTSVGYPLVIIHTPNVSFGKLTIDGSLVNSEVVINIDVYHTSAQNCKVLADNVTETLMTGRKAFTSNRLMNMNIEDNDNDSWEEGMKKIHRIGFNVTFRYVG